MSDDAIQRWRRFEADMNAADFGWTINYAAGHLVPSEPPWPDAEIDALLPEDFLAFTRAVGYPMVGYRYYCRMGFSILTPAWQRCHANSVFLDGDEPDPSDPFGVMFAGQELSDVEGWAFRRTDEGRGNGIEVWSVDGNLEARVAGSFTEWLTQQLDAFEAHGRDPDHAASIRADHAEGHEPDPHRLVDYSAKHPRTAECNALCETAYRDP